MKPAQSSTAGAIDPFLASVIIENATEYAILMLDFDGRIAAWSAGAERILGYSSDEALGRNFEMLFAEADRAAGAPRAELERAILDGRAEDTRWHLRKNGRMFWANGLTMRLGDDRGLVKVMRDETASKVADDQRVLLLNELNHRIKNTLATVQAIVEQTLRGAQVDRVTRESLVNRLVALSEAHNVLVSESWAGADLAAIVHGALSPYDGGGERFDITGPPVRLSPQQAVSTSLALHELTTNAIKYGALSVGSGKVSITWNIAYSGEGARHLTLLWRESGGPPVALPEHEGFGTRLIARSFGPGTGGHAQLVYDRNGLQCVLEAPLSAPHEIPMLSIPGDPSVGGAHKPPPDQNAGPAARPGLDG